MLHSLLDQTKSTPAPTHVFQLLKSVSQPAIWPYYLLSFIYIFVHSPFHPHPPETASAAFLKILPIWYLVIYVFRTNRRGYWLLSSGTTPNNSENIKRFETHVDDIMRPSLNNENRNDKSHFVISLLISSLGDVCLVYKKLFLPGVGFFSAAHVFILLTLRKRYKFYGKAWFAVPLCFLLYAVLLGGINDFHFRVVVLIYSILIHSMLFFAVAGYESYPCAATFSSMLGASLFVLSDFLIAYNKWLMVTPHSQLSILSTYYLAQLLLAVGNVDQTPSSFQH